ncbi:transposable element Tc3 transposase [Trichonephila clavipes]|nr:transposable element Tc3 transposase [Trichonephila clavipes]
MMTTTMQRRRGRISSMAKADRVLHVDFLTERYTRDALCYTSLLQGLLRIAIRNKEKNKIPFFSCGAMFDLTSQHAGQETMRKLNCQVIYSQFGLAIHQNDPQTRRRLVEWAQNEIAVVPDFHKRILFSDEAHFWLNRYVNKQNCRIWSEANPQVYVETPLHPEKLTVWCALWAGGILLQKR